MLMEKPSLNGSHINAYLNDTKSLLVATSGKPRYGHTKSNSIPSSSHSSPLIYLCALGPTTPAPITLGSS